MNSEDEKLLRGQDVMSRWSKGADARVLAKQPLVSIVTLTMDNPDAFKRTAQSVLSQDYSAIEYLVINGGSPVDEALDKLEKKSNISVSIINGQSCGIYPAMNVALREFSGDWINFMNAGDVFTSPSSISNAFLARDSKKSLKVMRLDGGDKVQNLWSGARLKNICQQTIFYNRKKLGNALTFDERFIFSADLALLLKIYYADKKDFAEDCKDSFVRYEPGGVSGLNTKLLIHEKTKILLDRRREMGVMKLVINMLYVYCLRIYLATGARKK